MYRGAIVGLIVVVVVLPTSPHRLKLREATSGRLSSKCCSVLSRVRVQIPKPGRGMSRDSKLCRAKRLFRGQPARGNLRSFRRWGESGARRRRTRTIGSLTLVPALLTNNLHQYPFLSFSVEFAIKNLFPRTEIEFAFGDGDHHFAAHDGPF